VQVRPGILRAGQVADNAAPVMECPAKSTERPRFNKITGQVAHGRIELMYFTVAGQAATGWIASPRASRPRPHS
jgi:hypothetical protein